MTSLLDLSYLKKKKVRALMFSLSLTLVFVSCNNIPNNQNNIKNLQNKNITFISGRIEFPAKFKVKATQSDVITETTVSLIYPANHPTHPNKVIASGVTDPTGGFLVNIPSTFSAYAGETFILEGIKRLGGPGKDALSLRTNLRWNGGRFESITTPSIYINTKTTALSVMSSFFTVLNEDTIGKMSVVNDITQVSDINSVITADVINKVKNLVDKSLDDNKDPVSSIVFKNGRFYLSDNLPNGKLSGCIGNPTICPSPETLDPPLPTVTPLPYPNLSPTPLGGCMGEINCTIPTPTPSVSPSPTIIPNVTPTPIPTPIVTPIPTPTVTPTPIPTPIGEFKVNTYFIDEQKNSAVAYTTNGGFVITWQSNGQDGNLEGIYAQRYDNLGKRLGTEFKVNTTITNSQSNPAISMDSTGNFVIVWQSNGQDGNLNGIYAQRYDNLGNRLGTEFKINNTTNGDQLNPAVAMDSNGNFVVTWQSAGAGIFAQRYNSSGVVQGSEFKINTFSKKEQSNPAIAMNSGGSFVITWQSNGQDGSLNGIYAQRYNSSGIAQGSEFRVNTVTNGDQIYPSVAIDSNANFIITWQGSGTGQDGSGSGTYAQRFDNSGIPIYSEFRVNNYIIDIQSRPIVAMDSNGNYAFTWESLGQDGSLKGIYAQLYDNAGVRQTLEFKVNTTTINDQVFPAIAMDSAGNFVITWSSYLQDKDLFGVYAQRFNNLAEAQ